MERHAGSSAHHSYYTTTQLTRLAAVAVAVAVVAAPSARRMRFRWGRGSHSSVICFCGGWDH